MDIPITQDNFNPTAAALDSVQVNLASADIIRKYDKVSRYKFDPEIPRQAICNISFMLLKNPQNGVYGFSINNKGNPLSHSVFASNPTRIN